MCHRSKDFDSHTRVCDEAKVNINLVHLHMGGQISSWPTFAHALCHVIGSLNINPTVCPKNVLAVVVPATLAVKACPSAGTHIPSPHGGIERSQLFTDGKTWKPYCGEVEDCTIVGRRSLNAQLSKNIKFINSCLTLNGKTSLRGNRILKGTQRCWRTLPHNIPRSVLAVMKKGIFEGPSTNVWPNHLRWFWSFFDTKINGLRVSMLHPICILVKIGRVIWVRQVLDSEGYVLRKVLCIFAVPFCKSIIKDRYKDNRGTYQPTSQQIELGFDRHLLILCLPSQTALQSPWKKNFRIATRCFSTLFCSSSGDTFFQNNSILCAALL